MRLIRYDLERQAAVLHMPLGGPFALRYASDTAPGAVGSRTARIPITGESLPDGLAAIEVEDAAGTTRLDPAVNLSLRVRGVEGAGTVRIIYVFSDGARSVHEQRLVTGTPDPRSLGLGGFLLDGLPLVSDRRLYLDGRRSLTLRPAPDGRHHARAGGLIHVVERGEWVGSHDAVTGVVVWRLEGDRLRGPLGDELEIDHGMRMVRLERKGAKTDVRLRDDWAEEIEQGDQAVGVELDDDGLLRSVIDTGGTTTLQYDDLGRLAEIAEPSARLVFRRDELPDGFRVGVTDGVELDERLEVRHRAGEVQITKRCCGREPVTVVRRPAGTETLSADGTRAMRVSGGGRSIVRVELPSGAAREAEVRRAASADGSTGVLTAAGEEWSTHWDPGDGTVRRISPNGRTETVQLDDLGRVTTHEAVNGHRFAYRYDGSRLDRIEGPDGEWDLDWDDDQTVTWNGPTGKVRSHRSPARVWMVDEHDVESELLSTASGFETSVNGRPYVTAEENGAGYGVRLGGSRLLSLTNDGDSTTVTSEGSVTIRQDGAGRPVGVTADGVDRSYEWHDNRLRLATSSEHSVEFTWDGSELSAVTNRGLVDGAVSNRRNGQGLLDEIDIAAKQFGVRYEDGRVVQLGPLMLELDERWARPKSATVGSLVEHFEYDDLGRLTERVVEQGRSRVLRLRLDRDRSGRVHRRQLDGGSERVVEFGFHGSRLTEEMSDGREVRFEYDDAGRLIGAGDGAAVRRFGLDPSGRLELIDGRPVEFTDGGRLAAAELGGSQVRFGYAPTGELVTIDGPAGTTRIERDPLGRPVRIHRADGQSTQLLWDETGPAALLDGLGQVVERYLRRPGVFVPEVVVRDEAVLRVVADQTGTIVALVDAATGAVTETPWSAYGEPVGVPVGPFGFGGGIVLSIDPVVVDIGRRSYVPTLGRWLQWDPNLHEGGGTDLYGYAANDPVNRHDPTGAEVQRCSGWIYTAWRDDDGDIRYVPMPAKHAWLKTSKYESGQDAVTGSYTEWTDHKGRWYPGASCEPMPDVDEDCVNRRIKPGTDIGVYGSWIKVTDHTVPFGFDLTIPMICWQVVSDVLDDCNIDNFPGGSCEAPEETMPPTEPEPEQGYTPDLGYTPLESTALDHTPDLGYTPASGPFGD
jgi:RHS repeat-associated protein